MHPYIYILTHVYLLQYIIPKSYDKYAAHLWMFLFYSGRFQEAFSNHKLSLGGINVIQLVTYYTKGQTCDQSSNIDRCLYKNNYSCWY